MNEPLKEGGRTGSTSGRNRLRHVLVASEVALALVVLCGAGLMIKSMARLLGVDPGLNPKNVLTMGMSVPQEEIYVGPPGLPRFCQDLEEHVGAVPGVVSVGAVAHLPFQRKRGPWLSRSRAARLRTQDTCRARTTAWRAQTTSGPWAFPF